MNWFVILFFPFFLSHCAFDHTPTEINQRENKTIEEKNRLLRKNYDMVTGFYEGKLFLENEERTITLGIYTLEVRDGNNSSGEPVFKPILKAVYRQIYPVEIPILLDGRYVPETGELAFINPSNQGLDLLHTISANLDGKTIAGVAKTPTGVLGNLSLSFVQKKVEAPLEGDEDRLAEKLRQQYDSLSGTYAGQIIGPDAASENKQKEWDVELGLYTLEVKSGTKPNGETIFRPVLKAVFKQKYPAVPNIGLEVQYIAETGQLFMVNPLNGTGELHTINAKLNNNQISGIAKKTSGMWGTINLNFIRKSVDTPSEGDQEDYNRRLAEEYQALVGVYRGTISPTANGISPFEVEVKIFIIQEAGNSGNVPVLKAYYRRMSDRYNATDLTMNVEYKTELKPPGVNMSGQRSNGGMTYFVVLNGVFQKKEIKGQYHDQRGHSGPFRLRWLSR